MALINCSECSREISDKASFCPQCGAPLEGASQPTESGALKNEDVRRKVTQANFNNEMSGLWIFQVFVAASGVGFYSNSWYAFGATLFVLALLPHVPILGHLAAIALASGAGFGGYWLGALWSVEAGYVVGGLIFVAALGANLSSIDWARDINKTSD
ncbi:MAG: zinc-ribbon domain-containing protein [Gammaproteobacteria bacterium]|nr:zinc-ribbon domain-containing protein [Gammaproteobacteria bacterium]